MANKHVLEVTDESFDKEVLSSEQPTLVDFWATWCPPCRAIAPHVDALAEQYQGRVRVGKVDVDENPAVAERYDVRSIPTLLVFKGGKVVGQMVGAGSRAKLEELMQRAL
jgi:thioredoxin 1